MACEGPFCSSCCNRIAGVRRCMPDGTGANGVALLGDSPYIAEVLKGLPFQGPAGFYLNSILHKRHLDRRDFSIYNVAQQCRPPHLGWTDHPERYPEAEQASRQCRPYLDKFIADSQPRAIVAMGNVALKGLTGLSGIEQHHGYVNESSYGIPTVGTFHPSHIIQGAHKLTISFVLAIARAVEIASGSYRPSELQLFEDPSIELLEWYTGNCADYLMCDIETPESQELDEEASEDDASYTIIRMGFSTGLGSGCSFPFDGEYIRVAKRAIERAKLLLFWNKNYDLPRLISAGFKLRPDVQIIDAMWLWHWIQSDLPKALAFAAPFFYSGPSWKHLAHKRPAYYNAMDNAIQTLCYSGCRDIAIREGSWDRFMRHAVRCEPILVQMGNKGIGVDLEQRDIFMQELQRDARLEYDTVQQLVPTELVKWKEWKRKPKSLEGVESYVKPALHKDGTQALAEGGLPVTQPAWKKKLGFNPYSSDQITGLIKHYGLKMPRKRGENRETTEQRYLLRFAKKYPVFKHIVDYKQRLKLVSTYQWPLNEQHRAQTVYGYHPSTWRLSSRKVNLQNIPKRSKLAEKFRTMLIASPGNVLVEADWEGIEAVLYGYLAGSPAYIKLAKAGIHDWLASHVIGTEPMDADMPWDELRERCKHIKRTNKVMHDACKHIVHGSNFLYSPFGIHDDYGEHFPGGLAQVTELQKLYFTLPAGADIRAYHERMFKQVHMSKKLTNHFGLTHYFYEIFKYDSRAKTEVLGDDAKRAAAFIVQSDAAFMQRELMLDIADKHPWALEYLCLPTHDSIVGDVPARLGMSMANMLNSLMSKKWPELGGLEIGVEVKMGANLEEQEEVHFNVRAA